MARKSPQFQRRHYEFLADFFGPLMGCPSDIVEMADKLRPTNPNFKADRFIDRATTAWEARHIDPYENELTDHEHMIESRNVA